MPPVANVEGAWIMNEERALKAVLQEMTVSDNRNPSRPVGVWFGQPDVELQKQTYPYATVDLIDVYEATERAHRNRIELWYSPEGHPPREGDKGYVTHFPIPYDLIFQITTYARHPVHDRQIILQMMRRFGGRWQSLHVPADDTVRSMFLVGTQKRDSTEDGRRLFSNAYTVQVFTELLPEEIDILQKVQEVRATFADASFEIDTTP